MDLPLYFFNFIKKLKKYLSLESFIFSYIVFWKDWYSVRQGHSGKNQSTTHYTKQIVCSDRQGPLWKIQSTDASLIHSRRKPLLR